MLNTKTNKLFALVVEDYYKELNDNLVIEG
jgi:hypothetical protein